jgi:hypothetical protein
METPKTTTIRVAVTTRDRLNHLANQREKSVDDTINWLMDELWKARCIDQADAWREDNTGEWRELLIVSNRPIAA